MRIGCGVVTKVFGCGHERFWVWSRKTAHKNTKMDGDDAVKHLMITGVKCTDRELNQQRWFRLPRVFVVDYNGSACVAKEIDGSSTDRFSWKLYMRFNSLSRQRFGIKENCLQECLLHSKLHHPNVVKMLGIYYPNARDQAVLPILVMEPMECGLTKLSENHRNIPMYIKLSILQDISRGICYLHSLNPPILHCNLTLDHILLTPSLVAKVYDFSNSMIISSSPGEPAQLPGTLLFMPPEAFRGHFGLPLDVFSFGCVASDVITGQTSYISSSDVTRFVAIEKRKHHIIQISEGSLKQLVITCLDTKQEGRPPMSVVSERITSIMTG